MTALAEQAEALRQQAENLIAQREIAFLERIVRAEQTSASLVESEWGEQVNRREYLTDSPGFGSGGWDYRATSASDRAKGKCTPFFECEQDLAQARGIARWLAGSSEVAIGALESLTDYTIGTGFQIEVEPKDQKAGQDELTKAVQAAVDEILEANNWCGDLETETFQRTVRDGEGIVWIQPRGDVPRLRLIEPDYLTEPLQKSTLEDYLGLANVEWSFGIATEPGNAEQRYGYFFQFENDSANWEFAAPGEVVHIRMNVDRGVKRGISDYYAAYTNIERSSKLLGNTLQGAAIQACIAYIKEHIPGTTAASIEAGRASAADLATRINKIGGGTKTVYQQKFYPGRVVETNGTKYHAGPLGQPSAPIYLNVVQAALRIVGVRWRMPEYMISADASNANYASTLISGGPFDRATQRRQQKCKTYTTEILWKCLAMLVRAGRFRQYGVGTLTELKRLVQFKIEAPTAAVADKLQDEEVRKIRHDAGVLSTRTWATQVDLDPDSELANGAKPLAPPSPFGMPGQGQSGQPPQRQPAPPQPITESRSPADRLAAARSLLWEGYP